MVKVYEIGELAIQGTNVMKGYFKQEDKTRNVIKQGWLYTDDIGYTDNEGYLFIAGKKEHDYLLGNKYIY